MPVDDHMRPGGVVAALGDDHRVQRCRHDLHGEAERGQQAGDKLLRAHHARLELRVGGDAALADVFLELFNGVKHARRMSQVPARC